MSRAAVPPMESSPQQRKRDIESLNPRQRLFAEKLLADRDLSPIRAAKAARYKNPIQAGWRLWRDERIRRLVGQLIHERSKRNGIDAQSVLEELARLAFADLRALLGPDGEVADLKDMPAEAAATVKKFKARYLYDNDGRAVGREVEVELWDKLEALGMLAKHVGLLEELPATTFVNIDWNAPGSDGGAGEI